MVTNCGQCLSMDPEYECGWCATGKARCSNQTDCSPADWLDRLATCPNPQILRVSIMWYVPQMPEGLALVAQLDAHLTGGQKVVGLTPRDWQHSFVEIDHEIFSTVILSLHLIQEGQLSASGERMCTILFNYLEN